MFERVFTVLEYHDKPLSGLANCRGTPHFYQAIFDEATDEYSAEYLLKPVTDELVRMSLESWAIWCRWREAFQQGKATIETHPALTEDRHRYDELEAILADTRVIDPKCAIRLRGEFRGTKP